MIILFNKRVAKFLQLSILQIPSFKVLVGDDNSLYVQAQWTIYQLLFRIITSNSQYIYFQLRGAYIILGALWLATLGSHITDYSSLTIQFQYNNQFITQKGEKHMKPHLTSVHQLHKLCSTKSIATYYTLSVSNYQDDQYYTKNSDRQTALTDSINLQFPA